MLRKSIPWQLRRDIDIALVLACGLRPLLWHAGGSPGIG
jgi:hypothetical protein